MKHIVFAVILLTLTASVLFATRPKLDYQTYYVEITDVERQETGLRVKVILKSMPDHWISFSRYGMYLQSPNDTTKKYHIIGAENIELDKRIWIKESGEHEAVFIYEKVPSDVNIVDVMETLDNGKIVPLAIGLHLDEKDTTPPPPMIEPKTLFGSASAEEWEGLDLTRYKDIPFYQENGKAHIKGQLHNYHPATGFTSLNVYTHNSISGLRNKQTENLNPDGTFEFDVNVDYPQYCALEFGDMPTNNVFVIPGDTLEIVTTTQADYLNPSAGLRKYFGLTGKLNDATVVNLLTDSLINRYNIDNTIIQFYRTSSNSSSSVQAKDKEIEQAVDIIIADLPNFLGQAPISTYTKDLLATELVARFMPIYNRIGKFNRLLHCDPLAISTSTSPHHKLYNSKIFNDSVSEQGVENCFALQLRAANALIDSIDVNSLHNRESLNKAKEQVAELTRRITYPALNNAVISAYGELAENAALEEKGIKKKAEYVMLETDKDADVLEELIKPYIGNLIYIDFWALWCAPCRQSMIDQKRVIERFAGQPFKVLYVSDDTNIAGSNQWLEKKGIPGEHIYISKENWKRIFEYFNLDYIPFGVLIGKDGDLLKTHFYLEGHTAEKEIERHLHD